MIGLERRGLREPEIGNLFEDFALARNAVGHDAIKGRNPVRGDKEQAVAEIKYFPDLAAFQFAEAGEIEF